MGNWTDGRRTRLMRGETLTCDVLAEGQLYGLILYNSQKYEEDADVNVVWSNSAPPQMVKVPGTAANRGLAAVVLVSGTDTRSVSLSMSVSSAIPQLECWIGSVSMPTDSPSPDGIINNELPSDGRPRAFGKYNRYYAVPRSSPHELMITSRNIIQFVSIQFRSAFATIYIVNPEDQRDVCVVPIGESACESYTIVRAEDNPGAIIDTLVGDGGQWVWMNVDSPDSAVATISLRDLSRSA